MRRLCTASIPASEAFSVTLGVVEGAIEEERVEKKSFNEEKDKEKENGFLLK